MADNYLERKMEEYRSGSLGRRTMRTVAASLPKGKIAVDFPPRIVIVAGESDEISRNTIKRFITAGCRTAFCTSVGKVGAELAQSTGARFYPVKSFDSESFREVVGDIKQHWGRPDTLIVNSIRLGCVVDEKILADFDDAEGALRIIEIVANPADDSDGSYYMANEICCLRNRIVVSDRGEQSGELAGALSVFICEPCGRLLAGQTFEI